MQIQQHANANAREATLCARVKHLMRKNGLLKIRQWTSLSCRVLPMGFIYEFVLPIGARPRSVAALASWPESTVFVTFSSMPRLAPSLAPAAGRQRPLCASSRCPCVTVSRSGYSQLLACLQDWLSCGRLFPISRPSTLSTRVGRRKIRLWKSLRCTPRGGPTALS